MSFTHRPKNHGKGCLVLRKIVSQRPEAAAKALFVATMDGAGMQGSMMMMQMMPIMMMMYAQNQGENSTIGSWFGINQTAHREQFQQRFNSTGDYDPYKTMHQAWFPVPKDVELSSMQKVFYYGPWLELLIVFGILAAIFVLAIKYFPKEEEKEGETEGETEGKTEGETEGEQQQTTLQGKTIAVDRLRAILDASDNDASALASIRSLINENIAEKTGADKKDD